MLKRLSIIILILLVVAMGIYAGTNAVYWHRGQSVTATTASQVTLGEAVASRSWADNDQVTVYDGTGASVDADINEAGGILTTDTTLELDGLSGALEDVGVALDFDGSSDNVTSGSNTGISGDATFSMSAWFKIDSHSADGVVLYTGQSGILQAGSLVVTSNGGFGAAYGGTNNAYSAASQVVTGRWYHGAFVKTPGQINTTTVLYLNGSNIAVSGGSVNTPNITDAAAVIGEFGSVGANFDGLISEVQIYKIALTAADVLWLATNPGADIADIYSNTSASQGGGAADDDIVLYHRYSDKVLTDLSEYGNDGTHSGTPDYVTNAFITKSLFTNGGYETGNPGGLQLLTPKLHDYAELSSIADGANEDTFTADVQATPLYHLFADNQRIRVFDDTGYKLDAVGDGTPAYNTWAGDDGVGGDVGVLENVGVSIDCDEQYSADGGDILDVGANDFCLSVRTKTATTGTAYLINKGIYQSDWFALRVGTAGKLNGFIGDGTSPGYVTISSNAVVNDDKWHHLAITFDRSGNATCYVDGVVEGTPVDITSESGDVNSTYSLYLGDYTGSSEADAQIDDAKIYIGGLWTAAQILYQATHPHDVSASAGTITEYYALNENTGTTITAGVTSPGNDLTLSDSAAWSQEARISRNLVNDGDMENANIGAWPAGDAATTLAKDTSITHNSSDYSLKLTNADASQAYVQQTLTTAAGEDYVFDGWCYGPATVNGASSLVDIDSADNVITVTESGLTATTWTQANFCFEVDDASTTIDFGSGSTTNAELAYWDDIRLYANMLDNGGMEITGSEILDEVDFATHAEWDVTNDFDDTGGNATYTWSANQTSTVQQIAADRVSTGTNSALYAFTYTIAVATAPDGDFALTLENFSDASVTLDFTAGTFTEYFWSASDADTQAFTIQAVSGTDTEGTISIDDVTCKEVAGWSQEANATVTIDTDEHAGDYELKVTTSAVNVGISQAVTLVTGEYYQVSGWARATAADTAEIVVDMGDTTTATVGSVTATSYEYVVYQFEATGTSGVVYCRGVANGDIVWFDDVAVVLMDDEPDVTPTIDSTVVKFDQFSQKLIWSGADDSDRITLRSPTMQNGGDYWMSLWSWTDTIDDDSSVSLEINGAGSVISREIGKSLGDNGELHRSFDLTSNYALAANNTIHDMTTEDLSFSCWIYLTDVSAYSFIAYKFADAGSPYYRFWVVSDGDIHADIRDNDSGYEVKNREGRVKANTWYHLAYIFDRDTTGKLYLNGVSLPIEEAGSIVGVSTLTNSAILRVSGSLKIQGKIADIKLYYAAGSIWSDAEILYQAQNPFDYSASAGTITDYWTCTDDAADTVVTGSVNNLVASANTNTFADEQWKRYDFTFSGDQDDVHDIDISISGAGAGANASTMYLDQVEVREQLTVAGDCEGTDGNTLPTGWSDTGSPDADETQTDSADKHSGSTSILLNAADDTEGATQTITVENGAYYTLSFFEKNNAQDIDVTLGTAATATIDATGDNTWTKHSYTFLTSGTSLVLSLVSGAAAQTGWFDDVSLIPLDTRAASTATKQPYKPLTNPDFQVDYE